MNVSKSTLKYVPAGIAALAAEQGGRKNKKTGGAKQVDGASLAAQDAAKTVGQLSVEIAKATKALTKREYMDALVEEIDLMERPAEKQKLQEELTQFRKRRSCVSLWTSDPPHPHHPQTPIATFCDAKRELDLTRACTSKPMRREGQWLTLANATAVAAVETRACLFLLFVFLFKHR
jgi:hypothetical protein